MHVCLLTTMHVHMHVDEHYYYLVLQEIDQYFIPQTWWHVLYCTLQT